MIRHYCDGCGESIDNDLDLAKKVEFTVEAASGQGAGRWPLKQLKASTLHAVENTWNGGDVCRDCLVRVITEGHRAGAVTRG